MAPLALDTPTTPPDLLVHSEEIVVTASRVEQLVTETTAPIRVIDRAEIEASGASSLAELLRTIPGLQVTPTHGGDGLQLQGMAPQHTLILRDGRPIAGRVDSALDLERLRLDEVERVEILPGPSSALYGSDALGGVVNLITRRDAQGGGAEAGARYGSRSLVEGDLSLSGERGWLSAGSTLNLRAQDGYDRDPSDEATTGDDLRQWGAQGWARARPGAGWVLDGDLAYDRRDRAGVDETATGARFDRRTLEEQADGGVSTTRQDDGAHSTRLGLSGSLWRQQLLQDQRGSDAQDSYAATLDRRALLAVNHRWLRGRHLLVGGLDVAAEALQSDRLLEGSAARQRLALYAQDDLKILDNPRLSLSPGARLDLDSQFGAHATPHLALRLDPWPELSWRLSGGQGYRAPDFKELYLWLDHGSYGYVVEGNPTLSPERSLGATTELGWTPTDAITLSLSAHWSEARELIDLALLAEGAEDSPARYTYDNVALALTRGAAAELTLRAGQRASLDLGYTFTDARDRAEDRPLDGRAPHRVAASARVGWPWAPLSATARAEWLSARPYTDDAGLTRWSEEQLWVDGRLAWLIQERFTLEAGVKNALDAQDARYLGLPPRTLYLGFQSNRHDKTNAGGS